MSEPAESDGIRVATHSSEGSTCQQENPAQQDFFMHGPCIPPDMKEEETKPLKITTLNVKNIEYNMQYIYKILKS